MAAVVALWMLLGPPPGPRTILGSQDLALLQGEMARASRDGLSYPRAGAPAPRDRIPHRDGNGAPPADLGRIRSTLETAVQHGEAGSDDLFWLSAACLVDGNLERAGFYLRRARSERPEDPEILHLSAILAYRESRLEEAESYLRRILELEPRNDPARSALDKVLSEQGPATPEP